jgi:hypothetical protein
MCYESKIYVDNPFSKNDVCIEWLGYETPSCFQLSTHGIGPVWVGEGRSVNCWRRGNYVREIEEVARFKNTILSSSAHGMGRLL